MRRILGLFVVMGLLCFNVSCSKSSNNNAITPPEDKPEQEGQATTVVMPEVDQVVNAFMIKFEVPGMSVAITRNGKLVYLKAYGKADKESNTDVTDSSLFRLASVSKPITSVAIMTLKEKGLLSLDDRVFGEGAILGTTYGTRPYNDSIKAITVRHLLQHTAGGWKNDGGDPMFLADKREMTIGELMTWTLDNRPQLTFPGTTMAYSNFGFCVLGRVIEKVSGMPYDEYVKTAVLEPAGITDMEIGGNTLADRKHNEVKYYGLPDQKPYNHNISRLDACGGWIASAKDLARFLVHVDGFPVPFDLLTSPTLIEMTTRNGTGSNYACGWTVNNANNWFHNGGLPGTSTEIVRAAIGYNWALLLNGHNDQENLSNELDALIWKVINNSATKWPAKDLF